jgi:hypothetical protein
VWALATSLNNSIIGGLVIFAANIIGALVIFAANIIGALGVIACSIGVFFTVTYPTAIQAGVAGNQQTIFA